MILHQGFVCPNCHESCVVQDYQHPINSKHLIETNEPPLGSEERELREHARNIVSMIQSEIDELDQVVERLNYTLQSLAEKRKTMVKGLIAAKGILSPIRRVPKEIISEIISYALGGFHEPVSLDATKGPWPYAQVCRLWRYELLSRPSLWAHIRFDYERYTLQPQYVHNMRELVARSKQHPVRINLSLIDETPISRDILAAAIEGSLTWVEADISLHPELLPKLESLQKRIPALEKLTLTHYTSYSLTTTTTPFMHCFSDAPALCHVEFVNFAHLDELNLPWSQLTHFVDRHLDYANHTLKHLLRMPKLVKYSLPSSISYHSLAESAIVLKNLHSLQVEQSRALRFFKLPALRNLTLHEADYDSAHALIKRSQCELDMLSLPLSKSRYGELLDLLHSCPTLTNLRLYGVDYDHRILLELHKRILPNLQSLTLLLFHRSVFKQIKTALDSLAETWRLGDKPRFFHIDFRGGTFENDMLEWMRSLQGDNLTVTAEGVELYQSDQDD